MKANREQGMLKRKLLADKMKKRQITKHTQNAKLQLRQQAMSQLKSGSFGGRRPSTGMGQFGLQKQAQMRMRERPTPIPSPPRRGGPIRPPKRGLKRISPGRVVGDINYRPRQKPRRAPDILKDVASSNPGEWQRQYHRGLQRGQAALDKQRQGLKLTDREKRELSRLPDRYKKPGARRVGGIRPGYGRPRPTPIPSPPRRGGPRPQGGAMGPDGNMYPGGVPNRVRRKYGMPLRNERPKPDYRTLRSCLLYTSPSPRDS